MMLFEMDREKGKIAALAAAIYFEQEKNKKKFQSGAKLHDSNWKHVKRKKAMER